MNDKNTAAEWLRTSSRAAGIIVALLSDCAAAVAKLDELGASF